MTISAAPMASGGMTPAALGMTVQPMVSTRKKVPMNSVMYLRMGFGVVVCVVDCWRCRDPKDASKHGAHAGGEETCPMEVRGSFRQDSERQPESQCKEL